MPDLPYFPELSRAPVMDDTEELEDPTIRTEFENGLVESRLRFKPQRSTFAFGFRLLTPQDRDILKTFYNSTAEAGANMFLWVHPETGDEHTVRFTRAVRFAAMGWAGGGKRYSASCEVREV
jgi:hypothetical protein